MKLAKLPILATVVLVAGCATRAPAIVSSTTPEYLRPLSQREYALLKKAVSNAVDIPIADAKATEAEKRLPIQAYQVDVLVDSGEAIYVRKYSFPVTLRYITVFEHGSEEPTSAKKIVSGEMVDRLSRILWPRWIKRR